MSALRTDEHSIQAGAEFIQALDDSVAKGSALQQALELQLANEERTARMKALQASCKACHKHFRD
jgi:cytochrome c556